MGKKWLLSFAITVVLGSCDKGRVYDEYESLSTYWHRDSLVEFRFNAPDTLQKYDLFINLRNDSRYPFSNIFLITEMKFPHGKVISDTLQYEMAMPDGTWLGTGFGEIKESRLWYKENFRFPEVGTYQMTIQQALRRKDSVAGVQELPGITEVGFRIEKNIKE